MTISPITDTIICNVCKGKNIIVNEHTHRVELCPKCTGNNNITEHSANKPKVILKG